MTLSETKLLDLLPESMRSDRIIKGFSAAWDHLMGKILEDLPVVNLFENLELLNEDQLDAIAEAMKIGWYNTEYEKEKKISLIRHYEQVCFRLGTVSSIQMVAEDIYDDAEVQDWYEYDSPQWRFKIVVDYGDYSTEEILRKLTRIVSDIKPAKATLNPVEFLSYIETDVHLSAAMTTCIHAQDIYDADIR